MTVYAIAQLRITDRAAYGRYQAQFMDVLRQYHGRLLVSDDSPVVVEGEWSYRKVVVLGFADAAAFTRFAQSPEYERISVDRMAGSVSVVLLVHGVGGVLSTSEPVLPAEQQVEADG